MGLCRCTFYRFFSLRSSVFYFVFHSVLYFMQEYPNNQVCSTVNPSFFTDPAAIISFGEVISIKSRQSTALPCLSVGSPAPKRSWHKSDAKALFAIQPDGSLEISSIEPEHSGNYSCSVSNNLGSDSITYSLLVLSKFG